MPLALSETLRCKFCVVFAGNIGSAQAVETLVQAASLLVDLSDVRLVLVGSGSRLNWVRQAVHDRGLENILLPGRFPVNTMPDLFHRASCLLVTLKGDEIFSYTVPGKVQAYLAAGKPIIAALNGEGARVVLEAGAGLTCPAEDSAGLALCVRSLHAMSTDDRQRLGDSGRRYFLEHFEMRGQADRLVRLIAERRGRA